MKVKVLVAQSCPTLWNPMDCSPPPSSIHGILQARILEWASGDLPDPEIEPRSPALQTDYLPSEAVEKTSYNVLRASQLALVVKNLPASAGDIRDMG